MAKSAKWHILWAWGVGVGRGRGWAILFVLFVPVKLQRAPGMLAVGWVRLGRVNVRVYYAFVNSGVGWSLQDRSDCCGTGPRAPGPMDADSPLDPRFLPDAVKGAENRGLSDEGLLPSHHKRGVRFPLQQQVPFLRSSTFFFCTYAGGSGRRQAPGSLGWRSRRHLQWPLASQALGDAASPGSPHLATSLQASFRRVADAWIGYDDKAGGRLLLFHISYID